MKKNPLFQFRRMREALEQERERLASRLAGINTALGSATLAPSGPIPAAFGAETGKRQTRPSEARRKSNAPTQRERWARQREASPAPSNRGSTPKRPGARHMSPEARERIAAAQRKRWAKYRAQTR